jgi:hypothetical protein
MAQMGHTSSALALEVYARKMDRQRQTGARMDALIRGADWTQMGTKATSPMRCCRRRKPKNLVGGAGLEPATSCL